VLPWDKDDGDAQLLKSLENGLFDFVYSSHCLEHMRDVPEALSNWTRVLKSGGWIYVVIPDYVLYEKMTWPSRFNPDHKQSFSNLITRADVVRSNHWHLQHDLMPLLKDLGLDDIKWMLESNNFNFNAGLFDQTVQHALAQLCFIAQKRE
jgi:ubiquinone/menaquinone biosynthesis C-methylase UbiE